MLVTIATGALGAATSTADLASGLADAFLVSSVIAAAGGALAALVLPSAATFLPKMRLAPHVAIRSARRQRPA